MYIHIGKEKYLCEYSGQNLSIATMEYNTIYVGTILCPECQVICGSTENFQCPSFKRIDHEPINTQIIAHNLCQKYSGNDLSIMSDRSTRLHQKLEHLFFFLLVLLYLQNVN